MLETPIYNAWLVVTRFHLGISMVTHHRWSYNTDRQHLLLECSSYFLLFYYSDLEEGKCEATRMLRSRLSINISFFPITITILLLVTTWWLWWFYHYYVYFTFEYCLCPSYTLEVGPRGFKGALNCVWNLPPLAPNFTHLELSLVFCALDIGSELQNQACAHPANSSCVHEGGLKAGR